MPVRGLNGGAVEDKQDQQQSKATRAGGVISFEQFEHAGRVLESGGFRIVLRGPR